MSSPLSSPSDPLVTFHRLPPRYPSSAPSSSIYTTSPPAHHVGGNPPTSFRNPWQSFAQEGGNKGSLPAAHTRFFPSRGRGGGGAGRKCAPVQVVEPDWGWKGRRRKGSDCGGGEKIEELGDTEKKSSSQKGKGDADADDGNAEKMKATWLGHASWLVETGVKRRAAVSMPSITLTDDAEVPTTTTLSPVEGDDDDISFTSSSRSSPTPKDDEARNGQKEENKKKKKEGNRERNDRGIRILLDPVFSARLSPRRRHFFAAAGAGGGLKRVAPPPCALADLPDPIDVVLVSHDHHDHLDAATVKFLVGRERRRSSGNGGESGGGGRGMLFLCGLGVGRHLLGMGVREEEVVELDWWEGVRVQVRGVKGAVRVVCTPSQHCSGRGVWDAGKTLWCSWVIEEVGIGGGGGNDGDYDRGGSGNGNPPGGRIGGTTGSSMRMVGGANGGGPGRKGSSFSSSSSPNKRLYFAGDTGYRSIPSSNSAAAAASAGKDRDAIAKLPRCPAFAEIGELYGPFDLALLPIDGGCHSPRKLTASPVHCAPEDAVCMHRELRSRKSVAMRYGTVRDPQLSEKGGDVGEQPPRRWREEAERVGLRWGEEVGVCKIGETVLA